MARSNEIDPGTGELQKYTFQNLRSIHYGINCTLKAQEYPFDIDTSDQFLKSRKAFDDACKELKKERYGHIKHTPEISANGKKTATYLKKIPLRSSLHKVPPLLSIKIFQSNIPTKRLFSNTFLIFAHAIM